MIRRLLLLTVLLPAGLWGQAAPLPNLQAPTGGTQPAKKPEAAFKEPTYPPLRSIELPKMASLRLSNGLTLYLVEDHELPVIQGLIYLRAGSAFDPADRPGLARVTLDLVRNAGTPGRGATELDDRLNRLGGRIDVMFSATSAGFTFSAPSENSGEFLKLLETMLAEPSLRLGKLEVAKTLNRSAMMRRDENSDEAALRHLRSAIYGYDSAYGRQESDASLAQIRRSDVTQFYGRYYVPANTALAIQGDFDPAAMRASVEKLFAGWTAPQATAAEIPKASAAPAGAYVVPSRNVLRVHFMLGQMGGLFQDRDAAAWEVLATVLGGMRRSRLIEHMHSPVPGDTVEVGAQWTQRFDHAGIFAIVAACAEPAFRALLEGIQDELKKLATSPVTEEEMRLAKDAVLAKLVGGADTKTKRLSTAMMGELAGLPPGFLARHQGAVAAVSRADVERLAKTLDPAHFSIVAIGDAEDLQRQLKTLGRTATIPEPAPAQGTAEASKPDPAAVERGRQLMARAQQASGGAEKVAGLKDATRKSTLERSAAAGGGLQQLTEQWLAPNHFRQETGVAHYAIYSNGSGGFVSDGIRSNPLSGALYDQVHAALFRFYPRLLLGGAVEGRTVFAVDDDAVEVREGARLARMAFDKAGLPSEIVYEMTSNSGLPIAVEEIFEDFHVVDGVKMPFRIRILHNGVPATVVTVQELKVNSGLKIEDLTKRQ